MAAPMTTPPDAGDPDHPRWVAAGSTRGFAGPGTVLPIPELVERFRESTDRDTMARDPAAIMALSRALAHHSPAGLALVASRGQWELAPHHLVMNQMIMDAIQQHEGRVIISVTVRAGKALDIDTPIPTPDGWVPIGKLERGDVVFDERGQQCIVTEAFAPYWSDDVHTVTFRDGTTLVADGPHQGAGYTYGEAQNVGQNRRHNGFPTRAWPDRWAQPEGATTTGDASSVRTTTEIADLLASGRRIHSDFYIPTVSAPLDLPDVDLPIDPYVLGAWLGDGDGHGGLTCADPDLFDRIAAAGYQMGDYKAYAPIRRHIRGLKVQLRNLGVLTDKHVPDIYLRASPAQRLALLQGLMDTDGGVDRGRGHAHLGACSFTNQRPELTDAVAELLTSLGAKVHRDQRPAVMGSGANRVVTGETAYRVSTSPPFNPFYIQRKSVLWSNDSKGALTRVTRAIEAVTPTDARMVRCISVDSPSHLYLAGESMVPTHNSLLGAKYTPAWYEGMYPDDNTILGAHEGPFAAEHSGFARDILTEYGPSLYGVRVSGQSSARNRWQIEGHTGGMRSVGVGGSPIGRGANLMVIDDPLPNYEAAMSERQRERVNEIWFQGTMSSRIEPGGTIIVICSRWHEEDLSGFLKSNWPGRWTEVHIPALCDDEETDLLRRQLGESFWPTKRDGTPHWTKELLEQRQSEVGPIIWLAQYQQRPTRPEGGIFPVGLLRRVTLTDRYDVDTDDYVADRDDDGRPVLISKGFDRQAIVALCRAWDLAATENDGDYTVGILLGRYADGRWIVLDMVRGQWNESEVRRRIKLTQARDDEQWGPGRVRVRLAQDPGQAGKAQAKQLAAMLSGAIITVERPSGSKVTRAAGFAAQVQVENVDYLVDAGWDTRAFLDELRAFDNGAHDDIVDACADAFNELAGTPVVDNPAGGQDAYAGMTRTNRLG